MWLALSHALSLLHARTQPLTRSLAPPLPPPPPHPRRSKLRRIKALEQLELFERIETTIARVRETHGAQMFDVHYDELIAQPMDVVRDCYDHFNMELRDDARTAMESFLAGRGSGKQNSKFGKVRAPRTRRARHARSRLLLLLPLCAVRDSRAPALRACSPMLARVVTRPAGCPPCLRRGRLRLPPLPRHSSLLQVSTQEHADFLAIVGLSEDEVSERLRIAALPPKEAAAARAARVKAGFVDTTSEMLISAETAADALATPVSTSKVAAAAPVVAAAAVRAKSPAATPRSSMRTRSAKVD
jgi:hypothetical protein